RTALEPAAAQPAANPAAHRGAHRTGPTPQALGTTAPAVAARDRPLDDLRRAASAGPCATAGSQSAAGARPPLRARAGRRPRAHRHQEAGPALARRREALWRMEDRTRRGRLGVPAWRDRRP